MNMPPPRTLPLISWAAPRWTWSSVVAAGMVTAAIFAGLPFLERLSHPPERTLSLRQVQTIALAPPPAPPPPPSARRPEPARRPAPRPALARLPGLPRPAPLPLALTAGAPDLRGDFTGDFALSAPDLPVPPADLVFEVADLDLPPRVLVNPQAVYPPQARMKRLEGEVVLEFVVAADGAPGRIEIVSSQPPGVFDTAARTSVARWRFQAGVKNGGPVAVRVRQKLSFRLE